MEIEKKNNNVAPTGQKMCEKKIRIVCPNFGHCTKLERFPVKLKILRGIYKTPI